MAHVSLEAFAAKESNEMSSSRQQHQDVKVFRCCRECLLPHLQGVAGGLVAPQQWVGHIVVGFVSTKTPATPWRWGRNQSLTVEKPSNIDAAVRPRTFHRIWRIWARLEPEDFLIWQPETKHLGTLGMDETIILEWIKWEYGLDSCDFWTGYSVGRM